MFKNYQVYKVNVKDFECLHNGKYIMIVPEDLCIYTNQYFTSEIYDFYYKVILNDEIFQSNNKPKKEEIVLSKDFYCFGRDSVFAESLEYIYNAKK